MYGLSVEEKELFLTKAFSEDVVVTIATFVVPFGSSKSDVVKLAKEMVAVLNRDLENRANDIAATPENIATSDQPQLRPWQKHIEEYRRFGGCTDKECTVCPPGRMIKEKFVLDDHFSGLPPTGSAEEHFRAGPCADNTCEICRPTRAEGLTDSQYERYAWEQAKVKDQRAQEEPPEMPNASDKCGDPNCGCMGEDHNPSAMDQTGLPVLETAGEIKEFPEADGVVGTLREISPLWKPLSERENPPVFPSRENETKLEGDDG